MVGVCTYGGCVHMVGVCTDGGWVFICCLVHVGYVTQVTDVVQVTCSAKSINSSLHCSFNSIT